MSFACPVCGRASKVITEPFEGYVEGWVTMLAVCEECQLTFSTRRDAPENMYESIYSNAGRIPGYDRYVRYASGVMRVREPLAWLASMEDPYLVAKTWLESRSELGSILELGSGFGYFTYALRASGYSAVGLDISDEAVSAARSRYRDPTAFYGPEAIAALSPKGFDVVIALEVVEHVADPVSFVQHAMSYVKPGGALVLSTPNRDAFDSSTIWESDVPPVHLTWFGSVSMASLAKRVDADLELIDVRQQSEAVLPLAGSSTRLEPLLSADGQPTRVARRWAGRWLARADGVLARLPSSVRPRRVGIGGVPRPWVRRPTSTTLGVALYHRGRS